MVWRVSLRVAQYCRFKPPVTSVVFLKRILRSSCWTSVVMSSACSTIRRFSWRSRAVLLNEVSCFTVSCSDSDPGQSGGVGCSVTDEIGEIGSVSRGGVGCLVLSRSAFDAVAAG